MTALSIENENDQSDIVSCIASKIAQGQEVTPLDLEALSLPAHVTRDNSRSGTGSASGTGSTSRNIPWLDRRYLQQQQQQQQQRVGDEPVPLLVRYIGMVQDMLETEYYITQINGKSTHYQDVYCCEQDNSNNNNDMDMDIHLADRLAERTPLVVVPIPFCSDWFLKKLQQQQETCSPPTETSYCTNSAEMEVAAEREYSKKRDRDLEEEVSESRSKQRSSDPDTSFTKKDSDHMDCNDPEAGVTSSTTVQLNKSSDWWPAGCMGSPEDHTPVLAKIYYDRPAPKHETRRLRLNDLVELVGVLSVDPSPQSSVGEDPFYPGGDDNDGFGDHLVLPPPSQLPRLHVLSYKLLDLDQITKRMVGTGTCTTPLEEDEQPSDNVALAQTLLDSRRQQVIQTLSESLAQNNNTVSEATLLTCLSMAQRTLSPNNDNTSLPSWDCVSTTACTLGCASLNLQLPSEDACRMFYNQLNSVLKDVLPIVANIDLTQKALNTNEGGLLLRAPRKDVHGRLLPSPLQLPKGATIIIHMGNMTEGTLSQSAQETLAALKSLVETHVVPYTFAGMAKYPFEADYRVFVVSTAATTHNQPNHETLRAKLLPCSLELCVGALSTQQTAATSSMIAREQLREYLASCRCVVDDDKRVKGSNNISLTKDVLERAQKDFVDRRLAARGSANSQDDCKYSVQEEDFHRWLTLVRLQARSRNTNSNERGTILQDWERSLALDDAMKKN
jgi:hypothetical protein